MIIITWRVPGRRAVEVTRALDQGRANTIVGILRDSGAEIVSVTDEAGL